MIADSLKTSEPGTLSSTTSQPIPLILTFDYNSGSPVMVWSGVAGDLTDDTVTVTAAVANFTLTLITKNAPTGTSATFTGTINWFNSKGTPRQQPSQVTGVSGRGTSTLTFIDNNPGGDVTWGFSVVVSYNGKTYTSPDPTIVNTGTNV